MAVAVAVDEQDVFPPRVLVSVTGLTVGDDVAVYRVVSAVRTAVRAGTTTDAPGAAWLTVDAEIPFGVPVSYLAVVNGVEYSAGAADTYDLPGGRVVVSDAITGLAADVMIGAWPEKAYARPSTRFVVGGRNVAVSGAMPGWSAEIEFTVQTVSGTDAFVRLLKGATQGTVQIRQAGGYGDVDCYVQVQGARARRFSQDGTDERRLVVVDALEVEPWAPTLAARGFTYADLEAAYTPGGTYADLAGDFATYLDLAQAEF
jgi:hypothetical protein